MASLPSVHRSLRRPLIWFVIAALPLLAMWGTLRAVHLPFSHGARPFDYASESYMRWPKFWPFQLPGGAEPTFFDLQVILWGCEVTRAGRDVYTEPPADATPYYYNYPRAWLVLSHLGLDRTWTQTLGLLQAAIFLIAVLAVMRPHDPISAGCTLAGVFCPPAIEAIAVSNNDLLLFGLLALAGWWWARRWLGGWPAIVLTGGAAILKLYPICALLSFLDGTRRTFIAAALAVVALGIFFFVHLDELQHAARTTPHPHALAIGSQVLTSRLLDGTTRHPPTRALLDKAGGYQNWERFLPLATSVFLLLLLAACAWRGYRRSGNAGTFPAVAEPTRTFFRLGACLHLAYFAIGHNWNHREILLILVVPWLLASRRFWLVLLIIAIWWLAGVVTGPIYLAVQLGTWVLTGALAYWLACDLAPDLTQTLRTFRRTAESAALPSS
ncbi:MAG TPA: hypothetical protein VG838_14735 [Opitutaceae bacterium]|nr:hypothetical protein [Opitutaceae bacterium]